jgi:hypothetical protein
MQKTILLICLFAITINVYSQGPNLDSIMRLIAREKSDSARFYLAFSALTESETNPVDDMGNAEVVLVYGKKHNDKVCLVQGLGCLGYDYRAFGNTAKSLDYSLQASVVAENSKDDRLIFPAHWLLAVGYLDLGDYEKAKKYGLDAMERSTHVEPNPFTVVSHIDMGEIFLAVNNIDSALIYTQKAYEISMKTGIKYYLCGIYEQLGTIQARLNNNALALSYLNLSVKEALALHSPKYINRAYYAIAGYYLNNNQKDSAIYHAKKAIAAVQHTAFSTMSLKPASMLLDLYRNNNVDSAFKYSEINRVANDSLYNFKTLQQAQLMTFEEDARQKEIAVEKTKEEEQRKENIQYALIAFGIITLIILYLLMSRSFITNTKLIEFFGVIALLIVFEFLNLLLHPFLESITHHSPLLMLLALVCIAALLVPLHHKIEHWATHKLVEKNKAMRLAAAKKTIERLEKN